MLVVCTLWLFAVLLANQCLSMVIIIAELWIQYDFCEMGFIQLSSYGVDLRKPQLRQNLNDKGAS